MKRAYRVERLARHEEKRVIKRIFTLSIFSIIIIAILFTLGIPTLGKFADLLDKVFKKGGQPTAQSAIISPPRFDNLPKYINQDSAALPGFATGASKVELWLNGEQMDTAEVVDSRFEFKDIKFVEGDNKVKVRASDTLGNTSDFSAEETITLDAVAPTLTITSPVEGQTFEGNNRIKVHGTTDRDAQVYANGFLANVDSSGNFEVGVPLTEGENTIEVQALDEAGNTKAVTTKVNFRK